MNAKGSVFKYPDNVDTDVIIPARHLNTQDAKELASHCMEDIDKDFVKKVKDGDIMVGGWNFGCGSSREHAPLVIKTSGTACVIAKSFARIHETNLKKQGMLALTFADKDDYKKVREEDKISIVGLKEFAPGKPLTAILYHADGTEESFAVNHTYNELQIKWFKAGAALNAAR